MNWAESKILKIYLTKILYFRILWRELIKKHYGGLAQLGERNNGIVEVRGSNPLSSTIYKYSTHATTNHTTTQSLNP